MDEQLDLIGFHAWIADEATQCRTVADSMRDLIDRCEAACPHRDWARLRALPYGDLTAMREWIRRPFIEEPPARLPSLIRGRSPSLGVAVGFDSGDYVILGEIGPS